MKVLIHLSNLTLRLLQMKTAHIKLGRFCPVLQILAGLTMLLIAVATKAEEGKGLLEQLQSLQSEHKIVISGLEKIGDAAKIDTSGALEQQVDQLFAGYNHIVTRSPKGKIQRVVIISKIQKTSPRRLILPVSQKNGHYTVEVMATGDGNSWQTLDMIIDTGADLVVLPVSLIEPLGLANAQFKHTRMQTANGVAEARIVKLKELKIAGETLENVETAFIADRLLGGNNLLGMSALSQFQVNIDDNAHSVTLMKK